MPVPTKSAPPEVARETAPKQTCIFIMGMHRSGTSALGGVLGLLGNDLPARLIGKDGNNEKGYFESAPLNTLNSEILAALGSGWDDWCALDATADFPGRAEFEERARSLLVEEFGAATQFVFKDPRNCRIGAFWLPLLKEAGCRIVALHTLRNPWEVAASLTRRDRMLTEQGLLLWLRHTLDAEWLTRDLPRFHTSYNLLMQDWRGLAEQAGSALGLNWKRGPDAAAAEINAFLARNLRHFEMGLPKDHAAWDLLLETYDILLAWTLTGETETDRLRLDVIRAQLDQAEPALQVMLEAAARREAHLHALEDEKVDFMARITRAESGWRKASEQLAELQIRTEDARRVDLGRLEARLQTTEAALDRRAREAEAQHRDLLSFLQAVLDTERRVKKECADLHQRDFMALKARHAFTRAQLEEAEAALETMRRLQAADKKARDELAALLLASDREMHKTQIECNRVLGELEALRASRSWRIIAPLRRMTRP